MSHFRILHLFSLLLFGCDHKSIFISSADRRFDFLVFCFKLWTDACSLWAEVCSAAFVTMISAISTPLVRTSYGSTTCASFVPAVAPITAVASFSATTLMVFAFDKSLRSLLLLWSRESLRLLSRDSLQSRLPGLAPRNLSLGLFLDLCLKLN